MRFDASLQGTAAGIGVAAWTAGQLEWAFGFPVSAGKSVPVLEMLAAFLAVFSGRFIFKGLPMILIGDNQYVMNVLNFLAPVRSPDFACLFDFILSM